MVLSITTRKQGDDITVVELAGRITLGKESGQIETTLIRLLGEGVKKIVIDLSKVDYLDSTGIGRIAYSFGKITQAGALARVSGARGLVMDLFRITRLDNVIRFFPDVDSACESLTDSPESDLMQVLQAGRHKLILLEIDSATIHAVAQQAGFEARLKESSRSILVDLTAESRDTPLLLFDAADPANLGWFSRCQFYVDGRTGGVMQTPITVANKRDRAGRSVSNCLRMRIAKELPASFRLPGKQPLTEQVFYMMLNNFLQALTRTGVAVCGGTVIQPLAGRTEAPGSRN